MTGFSLSYWGADDPEVVMHHAATGWRVSRLEKRLVNGMPEQVWQKYEIPENAEQLMSEISEAIGQLDLEGFTLFWDKDAWQMSTRRKSETGWSVTHISDEQAQSLLSMLEPVSHPLGPMRVRDRLRAGMEAATEARRAHTAALRAETAR